MPEWEKTVTIPSFLIFSGKNGAWRSKVTIPDVMVTTSDGDLDPTFDCDTIPWSCRHHLLLPPPFRFPTSLRIKSCISVSNIQHLMKTRCLNKCLAYTQVCSFKRLHRTMAQGNTFSGDLAGAWGRRRASGAAGMLGYLG